MNNRIKTRIIQQIKSYMNFMSKQSAIKKVKDVHLNRLDFIIDEVAKNINE